MSLEGQTFIVTGGGGFVGKALIKALVDEGAKVRSVARSDYPSLRELGAETFQHDLSSDDRFPDGLLQDVSGVFHTAAHVKMWGKYEDFHRTNVLGTRKLLEAASSCGIKRFVYTSSPSVIANGADLQGVDESIPYPDHFEAFYPQTKAEAEQEVLLANCEDFFTCSLRPHLIYGPGDTNLIPTVMKRAKSKKLKRIGDGENIVDFTYIDDCVQAHIKAMVALTQNPDSRGLAYFISQGDPYPLWQWIDEVLAYNELPPIKSRVSFRTALRAASIFEAVTKMFPFLGEPRFTRFLVSEMATDHYFDISRAKKLLGYEPTVTVLEGLQRTFEQEERDLELSRDAA